MFAASRRSGSPLKSPGKSLRRIRQAAFTMVELLVIIAIVAILVVVGMAMTGNRQSGAVRSMLDELEGAISAAHQSAVATGRDIALVSWGEWSKDKPLRIAYGDALTKTDDAPSTLKPTDFPAIVEKIIAGTQDASKSEEQTVTLAFHVSYSGGSHYPTDAIQKRARIIVSGQENDWNTAMGDPPDNTQDITGVPPFDDAMKGDLKEANNFCVREISDINQVTIYGSTKRFDKTVFIKIITTTASGAVMKKAPMGLLVLRENSASVYKFYNPGKENGDGKWRRI